MQGTLNIRRRWCRFRWSMRVKPRWQMVQQKCLLAAFMVRGGGRASGRRLNGRGSGYR